MWRKPSHTLAALAVRHPTPCRVRPPLRRAFASLSVYVGASASKRRVLEEAKDAIGAAAAAAAAAAAKGYGAEKGGAGAGAAVILASRNLVSWLEDEVFVSDLLRALTPVAAAQPPEISVLSAAVEGIPSPGGLDALQDGLSILQGSLPSLLPDLWGAPSRPATDPPETQPSITLLTPPATAAHGPLEVTVPLANTVFDNGRPSTMFASRWKTRPGLRPKLVQIVDKQTQLIAPPFSPGSETRISTPLLPITPARQILAGLGNIIRQLQVDGAPSPASRELEAAVPQLLSARAAGLPPGSAPAPLRVWALAVPAALAAARAELPPVPPHGDEPAAVAAASLVIERLVASGCRLQRVLSGGGGWGLKQGLLSLDPQTRHAAPGDEDVESFIRSFRGEGAPGDPLGPGSYVQFFAEPARAAAAPAAAAPQLVLGTCAGGERPAGAAVRAVAGCFGALSAQGVFLASAPGRHGAGAGVSTKMDVPDGRIEVCGTGTG